MSISTAAAAGSWGSLVGVFRDEIGAQLGAGMSVGLTDSQNDITAAATKIAQGAQAALSGIDVHSNVNADAGALAGGVGSVTINVSLDELEDLVRLGDFAANLRRLARQKAGVS